MMSESAIANTDYPHLASDGVSFNDFIVELAPNYVNNCSDFHDAEVDVRRRFSVRESVC